MPSPLLPPGFRFHPTDEELITHYLKKKLSSPLSPLLSIIADIDLYKFNPWELPAKALFGEDEWFFFTPRDRKYPNGVRRNRKAGSGYWKAAGTDKPILNSSGLQCTGMKKALVFYQGYPRKGMKTDWIMQEYRLLDDINTHPRIMGSMRLDEWVLCRVRQKSNSPKQIGTCSEDTSLNGIRQPIFPYSNDAQIYKHEPGKEDLKMEHSLRNYLNFEEDQPSKLISISTTDHRSNCINSPCNEEEMDAFKRTISFVSFGQAFPLLSPSTERLHSDAVDPDKMEDSSIFQNSYLSNSNCV